MILASHIRPFDAKQAIYVIGDCNEVVEVRTSSLEKYDETIMQLITEYGVTELKLKGNTDYCAKIGKDVCQAELAKYNNRQLKISIEGVNV